MEKYGVEEELRDDKIASAAEKKTCPDCSGPLSDVNQTGVLHCPRCGTKPFEEK